MIRVLVADDEPIERLVVSKKIQEAFGETLEVVMAENGEEAVQRFFGEGCRIAILDINMPGMDGLTAAEKIREKDKSCSLIFLTAYDEFGFAKKAFSVRALDYLLKPGSDEELLTVLEEAISRQSGEAKSPMPNGQENQNGFPGAGGDALQAGTPHENLRLQMVAQMMGTYIREHYREDISLQDAAAFLGYSDAYFCRIFKQCFDKNFTTYLTEYRIAAAKKLLRDREGNIKAVGQMVGFRDSNYFTKVFKRMTGETPSEYRASACGMA